MKNRKILHKQYNDMINDTNYLLKLERKYKNDNRTFKEIAEIELIKNDKVLSIIENELAKHKEEKRMVKNTQKHNGYYNYDTWQVILELDNDRDNYTRLHYLAKDMLEMDDLSLKIFLYRNFKFKGKINLNEVYTEEVKSFLKEFITEHLKEGK